MSYQSMFNSIDNDEVFYQLLSDIEPLPFDISYSSDFDPDSPYIKPMNESIRGLPSVASKLPKIIAMPSFYNTTLPLDESVIGREHRAKYLAVIQNALEDEDSDFVVGDVVKKLYDWKYLREEYNDNEIVVTSVPLSGDVIVIPEIGALKLTKQQQTELDFFERTIETRKSRVFSTVEDALEYLKSPAKDLLTQVLQRSSREAMIGFPIKARTMLGVMRACMGEDFKTSRYIRYLKYYLDQFPKNIAFFEKLGGGVDVDPHRVGRLDSMAPVRVHILMQAAWMSWDGDFETRLRPKTPSESVGISKVFYLTVFGTGKNNLAATSTVYQLSDILFEGVQTWDEQLADEERRKRLINFEKSNKQPRIVLLSPGEKPLYQTRHLGKVFVSTTDCHVAGRKSIVIAAPSGSGKSYYTEKIPWFTDGDTIAQWPKEFQWWKDPKKIEETSQRNKVIVKQYAEDHLDEVVLFSEPEIADYIVLIPIRQHERNFDDRVAKGNIWQPTDKKLILSERKRFLEVAAEYDIPVLKSFEDIPAPDLRSKDVSYFLGPEEANMHVQRLLVDKMQDEDVSNRSLSLFFNELTLFIFQDPWANTIAYKKAKSVLVDSILMGATGGIMLQWGKGHDGLRNYQIKNIVQDDGVVWNDSVVVKAKIGAIKEELIKLTELGLPHNARFYASMITAESTPDNWKTAMDATFIEVHGGYFRGNLDPAFRKQIAGALPEREHYPMGEYIVSYVRDMIANNAGKFHQTWKDYKASLPGIMTTRSAGGRSVKVVVTSGKKKIPISYTNKFMAYFSDPKGITDPQNVKDVLTWRSPGIMFSRDVPARDSRMVLGVPIEYYSAEGWWIPAFMRHMAKEDQFTITKESGIVIDDHLREFVATTDPHTLVISMDYSAFDAHENYANFRKHLLEGMRQGFRVINLWDKKILDEGKLVWKGYKEIIETQFGLKIKRALFMSKTGMTLAIDMVMSGEFGTIIYNNITNWSSLRSIWSTLRGDDRTRHIISGKVKNHEIKIQGDDSIILWSVISLLTADELNTVLAVIEETAENNGLEINGIKTMIAYFKASYLKKTIQYGVYQPRKHQIQTLTRENGNLSTDRVQAMIGLSQKHTEAVSRGQGHQANLDFLMFLGANVLKIQGKSYNDVKDTEWLPPALLYTPISMGGVGLYPNSIVGASKDAPIYLLSNRVERMVINMAHHIVRDFEKAGNSTQVKELMNSDTFKSGVEDITKYLKPQRVKAALEAQLRLENKTGKGVSNPYHSYARNLLKRTLVDDFKSRELNLSVNSKNINAARAARVDLASYRISESPSCVVCKKENLLTIRYLFEKERPDTVCLLWSRRTTDDVTYMNQVCNDTGRRLVIFSLHGLPYDIETTLYYGSDFSIEAGNFDTAVQEISLRIPKLRNRRLRDYMTERFEWLSMVEYEWLDPIPRKYTVCPIAGQDPEIEDLINRIGISVGGDANALKLGSVFRGVKDNFFPTTINDDEIFHEITRPGVAGDLEATKDVLIAMGAREERAMSVAIQVSKIVDRFVFLNKISSYSSQDGIIGNLDLSKDRYRELVKINDFGDYGLQSTLMSIGFLMIVLDGGRRTPLQPIRKIRMKVFGKHVSLMKKIVKTNRRFAVEGDVGINPNHFL
jgi:very-short-patch-repair endonuclease